MSPTFVATLTSNLMFITEGSVRKETYFKTPMQGHRLLENCYFDPLKTHKNPFAFTHILEVDSSAEPACFIGI